jgi:predicted nuclease of predicted toxin-antitoxin system
VKFLVDNQLPEALCRFLNANGHPSGHVLGLQMVEASDLEIWNYAKTDFRQASFGVFFAALAASA